ncbi:hypothetical protein C8R45DRAFT_1215592 [Mycena sanguinolenta]|nr:hypothetical protein C8R45DRAFT_1215592 [Mycena sanguinolenta]
MNSWEKVPNEVWLEIFRPLSPVTLKALSLTSNKFQAISRQLLFTHLDFHPYAFGLGDTLLLPPDSEVQRCLHRLEFWYSDEIARHVRSCNITPWRSAQSPSRFSVATASSPYILLDAFFRRLQQFTGLKKLYATAIHFTQARVASLCHAPALADVCLIQCSITDAEHFNTTSLHLGVSRFSFVNRATAGDRIALCLPLLRPQQLTNLYLSCEPHFLGEDVAAIPIFPHVHTLCISMDYSIMTYNLSVLSKFPAVQSFQITTSWGKFQDGPGVPPNTSAVLPVLQRYTGFCKTLALFLRPTLTHLQVHYCTPHEFTEQLWGTSNYNNLTSLYITFDDFFDLSVLQTVGSFFPMLTELRFHLNCEVEDYNEAIEMAGAFFSQLHLAAVPARLQRLAMTCQFENLDELDFWPEDFDAHILDELRDVLVKRCPGLTTLWLDGDGFLFCWRRSLNGMEYEYFTADEDEARTKRKTFDDFWGDAVQL